MVKQTSLSWDIDRDFKRKIDLAYGYDVNWKPHRELLVKAQRLISATELSKIIRGSEKKGNPVGFFINALKGIVAKGEVQED